MSENRTRFRLDQRRAPIYEALEQFRQMRVVPFDVPGHKRGRGNPELTAEIEALVRANLDKLNPSRTKTNREPVEIPLAAAAKMSAPAAKAAIDIVVDDE